jgi:putative Mn2+ efflux pump MntP
MPMKMLAAVMAVGLLLGFLLPYVLKMKDVALGAVILIGLGMMAVDLWQSLKSKDD